MYGFAFRQERDVRCTTIFFSSVKGANAVFLAAKQYSKEGGLGYILLKVHIKCFVATISMHIQYKKKEKLM